MYVLKTPVCPVTTHVDLHHSLNQNIWGLTNKQRDTGSLYFYFTGEKNVTLWDNSVGESHIVDQGFILNG